MIAGKRSPFGPKGELLVVLPHQVRHPIPLLRPILAHRAYASANETGSTGGRLASDHNYEALRATAAWHAHHETTWASPERGSPSLARRMLRGLRPRGGQPPKPPRLPVFAASRQKHGILALSASSRASSAKASASFARASRSCWSSFRSQRSRCDCCKLQFQIDGPPL